ncbi:MAG: hypothetical protein EBT42_00660, partial [Actinobacteria bacterium]|nr:hypothetical protein [Actinomycetota bacterium]
GFQALTAAQSIFGTENEDLNKTIVKLQAAMNLSMAIETFGGLGDKITAIKASFMGLAQTLGIVTVAQEGTAVAATEVAIAEGAEALAADGAAVSTGAFAVTLNALPLVAIVTALGLLVAGLITYASTSSNAAAEEKKRKKSLEDLEKQTKKNNEATKTHQDFIVKETGAFVGLALQLQGSIRGSKERAVLLKQINTTYGTTLKNLSNETLFQNQVNKSIENYLLLAEAKYKMAQNQGKIDKLIAQKVKLEEGLAKIQLIQFDQSFEARQKMGKLITQYGGDALSLTYQIQNVNGQLKGLTKSSFELGSSVGNLSTEFNVNTKTTEDVIDVTDKYASVLDHVKNKIEREVSVFEKSEKFRTDRLNGIEKETEAINKLYSDERQSIIDKALKNELDALDTKFKKEGKTEQDYLDAAKIIKDNYQTYLLESEKKLLEQLDVYQKEDLQNVQDNYTTKEKIVQESTQNIITNTQLLQIEFEKSEAIRIIDESAKTEEEKNKAKLEVRQKYAQQEINLLQKNLQEQKNLAKLNLDQTLADTDKTIAEKEQAQADYDQKIIKMTQETANKINGINDEIKPPIDKTDLEKSLEEISKYVDAIAGLYNQLSTTLSMIQDERSKNEEARIQGTYEFEKDSLDNQLAENIISRDQYDNKVKELDQQKEQETLQLKRQEFQSNKRLNMANAVITGAQAVLSTFAGTPGGLIIKGIAAALAATFAAIQFGVISSQEFTAAGGGIVPGTGSGNVDSVRSFLAPGETVINTQSSQMYPELLNSVNMAGGGVSLKPDLPAVNKPDGELRVFGDNKINQPLRAYVVETDVTNTQRRVDRIKRSAEF